MRVFSSAILVATSLALFACRAPLKKKACDERARAGELVINELVADNQGVLIDETGQTEDFFELLNTGVRELLLSDFTIADDGEQWILPEKFLKPGERIVFYADGEAEQGDWHLPFKLKSGGESLSLRSCGELLDQVSWPALHENESHARFPDGSGAFQSCRYASPGKSNGEQCEPPRPSELELGAEFAAYKWEEMHPALPSPLVINELALRPAQFIELRNTSDESLRLADYVVRLSPLAPGQALPGVDQGELISWGPQELLAPDELLTLPLSESQVAGLSSDPRFEGVVSVFDAQGQAVDRIDFMQWPEGASLARPAEAPERPIFCVTPTPEAANDCEPLLKRDTGSRVRGLRTPGDFTALAEGGAHLGTKPVKFVIDVVQGDAVYFLRSKEWSLHYTFIREEILGELPLDRCDPAERELFNQGWYDFSVLEYFSELNRKYYLGTLVRHGGTGLNTVEFALGDAILASDMRRAFFTATARVLEPSTWAVRPQDQDQEQRFRPLEGSLPLVPTNAPFVGLVYQPLTQAIGYGVLTWVPATELDSARLGPQTILLTDDVPNDLPLVGGLITEAFQTPLAHVNVLSQNRGTPNMALLSARDDERLHALSGELVRLEVSGDGFSVERAEPDEAESFWERFAAQGPLQSPRLDVSRRELLDLEEASLSDLPRIGAKAAQLAEMYRVEREGPKICGGHLDFAVPPRAFAIPVVHYLEHFTASGAEALLAELSALSEFENDPLFRAEALSRVRVRIVEHPVSKELLSTVLAQVEARFGQARVRFRSSSNAEDLPGFNGAGLYKSQSAQLSDPTRKVEDALREVWASLMNFRAYDERELARIDATKVGMGVLVHEAFPNEAANGVGVGRNILDPVRGDVFYLNSQAGEASVTNPAPGVSTEALEFQWPNRQPLLTVHGRSSLISGAVLSEKESIQVACALYSIQSHFRPLLDPQEEDPWFAMEIEYKLLYPTRELVVKQARPHAFGGFEIAGDCREL